MNLLLFDLLFYLSAMVAVPVKARILVTCAERPGYYISKTTGTCVKACDATNHVALFGTTISCSVKSFTSKYQVTYTTIPQSIVGLTMMTFLDLSGNDIIGTIPKEIGQLTELTGRDSPL